MDSRLKGAKPVSRVSSSGVCAWAPPTDHWPRPLLTNLAVSGKPGSVDPHSPSLLAVLQASRLHLPVGLVGGKPAQGAAPHHPATCVLSPTDGIMEEVNLSKQIREP